MRSSRLLYLLFVLVTLVVVPADTAEISETFGNPLRSEEVVDAPKANGTRWEVLEAVTNQIHFDNLGGVRQEDVYRFYLWERYKRSSRSERLETVKEIRELFTHMAYLDRTMDMIGMLIFGPENGPLILRSASRNPLNDDWQCHRSSMVLFEKHCAVLSEHTTRHPRFFSNICNNVAVKTSIEEAFIVACGRNATPYGIDVGNRDIHITPKPIHGSSLGTKNVEYCERVSVRGISRMKLWSYAKAYRVTVIPSLPMFDEWHKNIHICLHRDASLGLCMCEKDDWRSMEKGLWSSVISPYEQKFVDVKFVGGVSGYVSVTLDEVLQGWRHALLAVGIVLLFLAPVVSMWVSIYYASYMAIGVVAALPILLYQLGAGSCVAHYFRVLVISNLAKLGLSQHMQNLVSVFLPLLVVLLGAGLGYWLLHKYINSEDGEVDDRVARFKKWAIHVIAVACIILSSTDTHLAMAAVSFCLTLHYAISFFKQCDNGIIFHTIGQSKASHGGFYSTFHNIPTRKKFMKKELEELTKKLTRESVSKLVSSPENCSYSDVRRSKSVQEVSFLHLKKKIV